MRALFSEQLLREVKSWMAKLPSAEIDVLIVDEIGKNISGAGMDTKVINRHVNGMYNPWPDTPIVHRIYARGLSELTYHSGVGVGMADVAHDRLVNDIDWEPTYINFPNSQYTRLYPHSRPLSKRPRVSVKNCADGGQNRPFHRHLLPDQEHDGTDAHVRQ